MNQSEATVRATRKEIKDYIEVAYQRMKLLYEMILLSKEIESKESLDALVRVQSIMDRLYELEVVFLKEGK